MSRVHNYKFSWYNMHAHMDIYYLRIWILYRRLSFFPYPHFTLEMKWNLKWILSSFWYYDYMVFLRMASTLKWLRLNLKISNLNIFNKLSNKMSNKYLIKYFVIILFQSLFFSTGKIWDSRASQQLKKKS